MYYLSDICSLCVRPHQNLKNIISQDKDGIVIEEKLKSFFMELVNFKPGIAKYACNNCIENLNYMYKFRLKCLKNITTLNEYLEKRLADCVNNLSEAVICEKKRKIEPEHRYIVVKSLLDQTKSSDQFVKKEIENLETQLLFEEPVQKDSSKYITVKSEFNEETQIKEDNIIRTSETTEDNQTKLRDEVIDKKVNEENLDTHFSIEEHVQKNSLKYIIVKSEFSEELQLKEDNNIIRTNEEDDEEGAIEETLEMEDPHIPFEHVDVAELEDVQKLQLLSEETYAETYTKNDAATIKSATGTPASKPRKQHKCTLCDKVLPTPSKLEAHMRHHTGARPYQCSACSKCFMHQANLKRHSRTHSGERPYACDVCSKTFSDVGNLIIHKRIHNNERPYECRQCGKCFIQHSALSSHVRTHTGEKPFHCHLCQFKATTGSYLKRHLTSHNNARKPHVCAQCQQPFSSLNYLKRHVRQTHRKRGRARKGDVTAAS